MSAKPIARFGDQHVCPIPGHGVNSITSASPTTNVDGRPAARQGDMTACGATITLGEKKCPVDGKPVAYLGSLTSHGGQIVTGSHTSFVEVSGI